MSPTRQLQETRKAGATTRLSGPSANDNKGGSSRPFRNTREKTVAAEDLETEVLFPEARRLRRRRWTIGVAVVAAALIVVALFVAGASLSSASSRPAGTKGQYALPATSVGTS